MGNVRLSNVLEDTIVKRQFISITVVLAVLLAALVTFAQQDDAYYEREGYGPEIRDALETVTQARKSQAKALEILPDHLAKLSDLERLTE